MSWKTGYDIVASLQSNCYWSASNIAATTYIYYNSSEDPASVLRQGWNYKINSILPVFDMTYVMFGVANTQQFYTLESKTNQWVGSPNSTFNGAYTSVSCSYAGSQGHWFDPSGNTGIRTTTWPWAYNWAYKCLSGSNTLKLNIPNHWGLQTIANYHLQIQQTNMQK